MVGQLIPNKGGFLRPGDSRDIKVMQFELEKDNPTKIKELYAALHGQFSEDGWKDPESGDNNWESLYWERILENGFKEHHVWWRLVKQPIPGNNYFRWACKIDFQSLLVRDGEIAYKGKKKKVQMADLIIRVWFFLQLDPDDMFKDSILKTLQYSLKKELYKDEIDSQMGALSEYGNKIQRWLKTFQDMEVEGERETHFHPEGGYKDPYAP